MSNTFEKRFQIPWYKDGLSFGCTQCGKCCTGAPGYILVNVEEMKQMAEFLNISVSDLKRLYMRRIGQNWTLVEKKSQNHNCVFYQNQKCQVYAARPLQCRAYPFWQENLVSEESWKAAAAECEGINAEAPLIAFETIDHFLEKQRREGQEEHFVSSS